MEGGLVGVGSGVLRVIVVDSHPVHAVVPELIQGREGESAFLVPLDDVGGVAALQHGLGEPSVEGTIGSPGREVVLRAVRGGAHGREVQRDADASALAQRMVQLHGPGVGQQEVVCHLEGGGDVLATWGGATRSRSH